MTATLDRPLTPAAPPVRPDDAPAAHDPRWVRPALITLLVATGLLYTWDLAASGWANSFYAAAVQSGSHSWKAWFFGGLDSGGAITVDKPPGSLWIMGLSARIFGFNSWSLLVPQALEGVAAVGFLYAAVRRWSGPAAGLVAGAALALTPAAALMFRFDNPDALLTLLLTVSAWCLVRGLEEARTRWLLAAGCAIGFAFLTKMLQGFLVVPGFALVWLVAAPTGLGRRVGQLLAAGMAMVVSAGWWVAVVQLWPASSRPYIGGSTNNTVMDLVLGYNGLGRINGSAGGGGGGMNGGASGSSFGGATGWNRLFGSEMGNEISWLMPAAVIALLGGLWLRGRAPRTDRTRAALLLWGTWFLVTAWILSTMKGVVHPYYTVALAPAVAGLVAVGGAEMWRQRRDNPAARVLLSAVIAAAGIWSWELLGRDAGWKPWLRAVVLLWSVGAALVLLLPSSILSRKAAKAAVLVGIVGALLGTGGFAVATAATPHTGSIPSVGPASAATGGMGGGPGGGGGMEGSSSTALTALLKSAGTKWSAATNGSQSAATLELASGTSVIGIGGWSNDPAPTLAQFEAWVAAGDVHYYVSGGQGGMGGGPGGGPGGGSSVSTEIATWVAAHFTATTVGGSTVYDLTAPVSTTTTT